MKNTFTQSMAWLHTWAGLIFGWLLFAIFATGTLAVFDSEIDNWMRPEVRSHDLTQLQAAQRGLAYLTQHAPGASNWNISLPDARSPGLQVASGERRRGGGTALDPHTGEPIEVRETAGGSFFFRFHFTLNLPRNWGIFVVGALAIVMLVGLVSGIVIHKKIFKEFFTFRPGKGQRSWLDFHNASAVLLLPFHLMITYTGLVIFLLIYMPAAVDALFEGDNQAYYKAQGEQRLPTPRAALKQPAALVDLAPVLASAQERLGAISSIGISNPGTAAARIEVRPTLGYRIALSKGQAMVFDGVSGELLRDVPDMRPAVLTQRVMAGLHFAQFGGYPMRWLYFVCALVSTAMIGTGLVLFCVKRRRKYASASVSAQRWYKVAESFNVAFVAGLMLACAGLLWANRLLPVELAQRANWEVKAFFAVWLLSLLHAGLRPAQRAWAEQLGLAAVLCIGLPVLGALTAQHDPAHRVLEATSVVLGGLLAYAAWRCVAPREEQPARKRATVAVEGQ
jgi:uncharacterized iron-regulated membrane protein